MAATTPETQGARADEDMLLPPLEVQAWVIGELAALVRERGYEPLVNAPLLEPSATFFPDRWAGGEASVRRLLRRLLHYAGMGDHEVEVTVYEDGPERRAEDDGKPTPLRGEDVDIWWKGQVRDPSGRPRVRFGAEAAALRDPAGVVAAAARAVARAYRQDHGLSAVDRAREERLVDLTTIFLGFGALTTDAAHRHVSKADGSFRSKGRVARLGVTPPQVMAFALAAQARARGLERAGLRRIAGLLRPNQAAFFRRALEVIDEDEILDRLGLPDPESWAAPASIRSLIPTLADDASEDVEAPEAAVVADRGVIGMNAGKPVFRVERSAALRVAKLLALPVVMLGGVVVRGFKGVELPMQWVVLAAAALGIVGLALGRLLRDRRCSEPKCGQVLSPEATTCPRCGGTIMGVISHPRERLAAEEALRRSGAERGDAAP